MRDSHQIKDLCERFPVLQAKFIVDTVNCLDVAHDHIRTQKQRHDFFQRMVDAVTGSGNRRQERINENLHVSLKSMLQWANSCDANQTLLFHAAAHAVSRLRSMQEDITKLAHLSLEHRAMIIELREVMENRLNKLDREVQRLSASDSASWQLEKVVSQWQAGDFAPFSLARQCLICWQTLKLGPFGTYCLSNRSIRDDLLEIAANKFLCILRDKANYTHTAPRPAIKFWLEDPKPLLLAEDDACAYLGDWADIDKHPFTWAASKKTTKPLYLPKICDPERLVFALRDEIISY